ncbi:MAG: polysaccharide pyruvyl transferase family protein [Paludibacteraceae bacterium]|nr:polysaccharide pyruvyl transferase family protein [Paludibacteraceae bacterium]
MKIGILTQPIINNYGGILQAWALQNVLKQMGHDPTMIRFCRMEHYHSFEMRLQCIKRFFKNCVRVVLGRHWYSLPNEVQTSYISQNTKYFVDKYITPISHLIISPSQLKAYCNSEKFDAYIVGSDQVWRPMYSPKITNFFLDFTKNQEVKRIAYAASFGTNQWEFTATDTKKCAKLARRFDGISVREDSGIRLCKEHLEVNAIQVLDPTLLLKKNDYEELVTKENESPHLGNLFCYVLDKTEEKNNIITTVANKIGLTPFSTMPSRIFSMGNYHKNKVDCVYPAVTAWLRSFIDAKFVLTDSFHGCAFSILFNKPFIAIGNIQRGQSRFNSLLKLFNLESRLCMNIDQIILELEKPINWESVNEILDREKKKSIQFLCKNIE